MPYNYLEDFLEDHKTKPFVTNLQKYNSLDFYGKCKVVSSYLTHLFIDAQHGKDNQEFISEAVSILNEMVFYKVDNFLQYIENKIK